MLFLINRYISPRYFIFPSRLCSGSFDQPPQREIVDYILTSLQIVFQRIELPSQSIISEIQLIVSFCSRLLSTPAFDHTKSLALAFCKVRREGSGDAIQWRRLTREYEAKMSLTKVAIRVGSSKFWAVTELIDNRGWDQHCSQVYPSLICETQVELNWELTSSLTIPITPCR